jgi:predicted aspartyl protease
MRTISATGGWRTGRTEPREGLSAVTVRLPIASLLLALSACSTASAPTASGCRAELAASLKLRVDDGALLTQVTINDRPAAMLVDTGSSGMFVTPEAQARFGLPDDPHRATVLQGVGGTVTHANVVIRRFGIGGLDTDDVSSAVGDLGHRHFSGDVAGLIGADYLSFYDLDFDVPDGHLNLYRMSGCGDDFRPAGAVGGGTPLLKSTTARMLTEMHVQSVRMLALFDTGADRTTMTVASAHRLGLSDAALAADVGATATGADGTPLAVRRHLFTDVDIAGEHLPQAWFQVSDVRIDADVLLGVDWLRGRRAWVSYAAARMFTISPGGGPGQATSVR